MDKLKHFLLNCHPHCHRRRHIILSKRMRLYSSTTTEKKEEPVRKHHEEALDGIVQWLTSDSSVAPRITSHFSFKKKSSSTISIQTQQKSRKEKELSPVETLSACMKLLTPLALPCTQLSSSNLLRTLPQPPSPLSIEFSSPNIAKPLHMGHLRSTITGAYVRKIAEFAGHDCTSLCFLGDWGRQFGVLRGGVEEELKKQSGSVDFTQFIKSLELEDLLQLYVKASNRLETDEEFKADVMRYCAELEGQPRSGDNPSWALWEHTRSVTVDHLKSCYKSLDITFDVFEGESEFRLGSQDTATALQLLEERGLASKAEDGCVRLKEGNHVLLKRDGSSVYLLRDVVCALRRLKSAELLRRFVYVVDSGQGDHFRNLFATLRSLGVSEEGSGLPFTSTHSLISFNRVIGMSTRSGNFVLLSQVISEGTQLMHEERQKSKNARNTDDMSVSQQLAVSGLIINSLKMRRGKSYEFDWGEALRSSGNSGVSLQYSAVRLGSLFKKVREEIGVDGGWDGYLEGERELGVVLAKGNEELVELVVCLMNFEDTFWKSYTQLEACVLVTYCFTLSDKISRVLASIRIIDGTDRDLANATLWVLGIGEKVLHACMGIVGVKVVEGGF